MGEFKELKIWQKAHELTIKIYMLTNGLPKSELFVLVSQLRRAAISVESNIAEGENRYSVADKNKFLIDARASCAEVRTQLLLVSDLYEDLKKDATNLEEEYRILAMQINKLISYRRVNAQ